jgi:hypothetical protein
MIILLKKQIYKYNLVCSDIRPNNYVVNLKNRKEPEVKMIDFEACNHGSEYFKKIYKDLFYFISICKLHYFIYDISKSKNMSEYETDLIMDPLESDTIFKNSCTYVKYLKFLLYTDNEENTLQLFDTQFGNTDKIDPFIYLVSYCGCYENFIKESTIKEKRLLDYCNIKKKIKSRLSMIKFFSDLYPFEMERSHRIFYNSVCLMDLYLSDNKEDVDNMSEDLLRMIVFSCLVLHSKNYENIILNNTNIEKKKLDYHVDKMKKYLDVLVETPMIIDFLILSNDSVYHKTIKKVLVYGYHILIIYKPSIIAESIAHYHNGTTEKSIEKCINMIKELF